MCRNGTDFGIRVSGTGDRWFTAPVEMPDGLYFPGYSEADANPDMGDSAIVETDRPWRLRDGGGARSRRLHRRGHAATAVHLHASDGRDHGRAKIRNGRSRRSISPACRPASMCGSSSSSGVTPAINTGIAHKNPASARSAPASRARRWLASSRPSRALAEDGVRMSGVVLNEVRRGVYLDFGRPDAAVARRSRGMPGHRRSRDDDGNAVEQSDHAGRRDCSRTKARRRRATISSSRSRREASQPRATRSTKRSSAARQAASRSARRAERGGRAALRAAAEVAAPASNLALISVPGDFAAAEARKALIARSACADLQRQCLDRTMSCALKQEARGARPAR